MAKSKPGKSRRARRIPCSGEASIEIHCRLERNSWFMVTRPKTERIEPTAVLSRLPMGERYFWVGPTRIIQRIRSERDGIEIQHFARCHNPGVRARAGTDPRRSSRANTTVSSAAFGWYTKPRFEWDL